MALPIVHHAAYVAPMPAGHRFPMGKFGRLMTHLLAQRVVAPGAGARAGAGAAEWLGLAHAGAYVNAVLSQSLDVAAVRRIGLPVSAQVATRARAANGGTVLTARLALEYGLACNTAGGSHHAFAGLWCGLLPVQRRRRGGARAPRAEGLVERILVVDLDVHQGDGTAAIFRRRGARVQLLDALPHQLPPAQADERPRPRRSTPASRTTPICACSRRICRACSRTCARISCSTMPGSIPTSMTGSAASL